MNSINYFAIEDQGECLYVQDLNMLVIFGQFLRGKKCKRGPRMLGIDATLKLHIKPVFYLKTVWAFNI